MVDDNYVVLINFKVHLFARCASVKWYARENESGKRMNKKEETPSKK